ncbi:PQQ-binding-like beta-propeller repeat protein [Sedimentisphaera salicampi]|uniref:Outer membrane protein assembly factor BamB n=1 Tax=Sedimentisphaera salicampi TaxID=1941349 RepID=A0A1W6LPD4_9BACT|nr:PQQ-binding-like beta-propeller repeat protein [Sedimentisphaera salicampi]ARN57592.1 Outer membrane protein assembly factor BamB precursor [Sedimentisphaera salicampi]
MISRIVLLLSAAALLAGCQENSNMYKQSADVSGLDMVPVPVLEENGYELEWQRDMPIKKNEEIKFVFRNPGYFLTLTNKNVILCYNIETGKQHFIRRISRPGLPLTEPSEREGILYTTIGDVLWSIDVESADIGVVSELESPTRSPVVFNSYAAYVIGLDKRISCYSLEDGVLSFQVTADNDSKITTALVNDEYLWFATKQGNIYCSSADEAKRIWAFDATDEIKADMAARGDYIYTASMDTMLYKLNAYTGSLQWKAHLGSPLLSKPVVYDDVILQQTSRNGLCAVKADNGKLLWMVKDGTKFLSRKGDRVFVLCEGGIVKKMSLREQECVGKMKVENLDTALENTIDSRIFLVSKGGRIYCLDAIRTVD